MSTFIGGSSGAAMSQGTAGRIARPGHAPVPVKSAAATRPHRQARQGTHHKPAAAAATASGAGDNNPAAARGAPPPTNRAGPRRPAHAGRRSGPAWSGPSAGGSLPRQTVWQRRRRAAGGGRRPGGAPRIRPAPARNSGDQNPSITRFTMSWARSRMTRRWASASVSTGRPLAGTTVNVMDRVTRGSAPFGGLGKRLPEAAAAVAETSGATQSDAFVAGSVRTRSREMRSAYSCTILLVSYRAGFLA